MWNQPIDIYIHPFMHTCTRYEILLLFFNLIFILWNSRPSCGMAVLWRYIICHYFYQVLRNFDSLVSSVATENLQSSGVNVLKNTQVSSFTLFIRHRQDIKQKHLSLGKYFLG